MNQELQQNAIGAGEKATAAIASGATVSAGLSTYLEIIPAIIGSLASFSGLTLSCVLIYCHIKKGRLERKQLRLQNSILEEKEANRKEEEK